MAVFGIKRRAALRGGASLLETALAVAIMGMVMGSVAVQQSEQAQRDRAYLAADRLKEVQGWVVRFLDVSSSTLVRTLPIGETFSMALLAGGPGESGAPTLDSLGFVPEGYRDGDSWGHHLALLLRQSSPGSITVMVVQVGGRPMSDKDLGNAMMRVGPVGGGVFTVPPPGIRDAAGSILGTGGGWRLSISDWSAGGIRVENGHAVAKASISVGNLVSAKPVQPDSIPPLSVPPADIPEPPMNMRMQ